VSDLWDPTATPERHPLLRRMKGLRTVRPLLFALGDRWSAMLIGAGSGAGVAVLLVFFVAIVVFEIAALWPVFRKGGRPGRAAIVPFCNRYVLLKVALLVGG
jgi:hypothetical protein